MQLDGIHHISCITGDAPANLDFYTRVLGMRLVAKTVNQDDPGVYHLFYGDYEGTPAMSTGNSTSRIRKGLDCPWWWMPAAINRCCLGIPTSPPSLTCAASIT